MNYPPKIYVPGCDDAPFVEMVARDCNRAITLVLPYYENQQMLEFQLGSLCDLKKALRSRLTVIVVDDGSPLHPLDGEDCLSAFSCVRGDLKVRAFRIKVDVRWNWLAARNLGMHHAAEGFCVLTDIDHMLPAETLEVLIGAYLDPGIIYRFNRRSGGLEVPPHPNSWCMTRSMFWHVGGYDEALSGHYGTDGEFRRRCAKKAPIRILTAPLTHLEGFLDSYTTLYARKQPEDARARKIIAARPMNWQPKTLSFPWEEIDLGDGVPRETIEQAIDNAP